MNNLYLFFITSLVLNITPGNDVLYVTSRSISQGTKGGIISALGIFTGCFVHIFAACLGLSIIIAKSAYAFQIIKLAGAGYLIYLGVRALLSKAPANPGNEKVNKAGYLKLFKQGVLTNALNPKVAIFFLSFLPQFINPASLHFRVDLFLLGIWFSTQGTMVLMIYACIFGRAKDFFKNNPKAILIQEKIAGLVFIGLGIKIVLAKR
jgi:threonine/homoserine/homoserine lactone efflux protein